MAKRKTKADLERELEGMRPYQEAYWALRRGEKPIKLTSGEYVIEVLALRRAHGGLVIDTPSVYYLEKWTAAHQNSVNPYIRELARKAWQLSHEAAGEKNG